MTDDFEFDPLESELRRRFDTLEAGQVDPDLVLDAMRPRLRRAQRNRRIMTSAAASLAVAAVVVVGLTAFRDSDTGSVRVTPPATHSPAVSTTNAAPDQGTPAVSAPDDNVGSGQSDDASEPVAEQTTTPVSSDTPYASAGGSIVVHRSGSAISLGSSTPAAGYTKEVHDNGPTRVEVRFNNGQTEWRIRVDLVNGTLQAETTQH